MNLRKFFARKRVPTNVTSDNGSQFLKCDKDLKNILAEKKIEWKMITPYSPWKGGFYERLIGLTKKFLVKTIGQKRISLDELSVVITEIENMINNRPLSCVDSEFDKIITPKSLEVYHPDTMINNFDTENPKEIIQSRADLEKWVNECNETIRYFWNGWSDTYLEELREMSKKRSVSSQWSNRTPKVGQIVLCREANVKRYKWPMAIIEKVIISKDGEIRSVVIRNTEGMSFLRSVNHLIDLEIDNNADIIEQTDKEKVHDPSESISMPAEWSHNENLEKKRHEYNLRPLGRVNYKPFF